MRENIELGCLRFWREIFKSFQVSKGKYLVPDGSVYIRGLTVVKLTSDAVLLWKSYQKVSCWHMDD